jgi:hypothetical protein
MARKSSSKGRKEQVSWRIDGISAEAVAAAKRAAAGAGVPLGAWLSRLIDETAQQERIEREQQRTRATED